MNWHEHQTESSTQGSVDRSEAPTDALQVELETLRGRVRELEVFLAAASTADRKLAAIIESSDDAIISKDLNGIIQSWNRGAREMFGYTAEEVIGKHISILAVPEVRDEIPGILARISRGERVEHYQTRRQRKDGKVLTVSVTISPIADANGVIVGASKVARDITERELHIRNEQKARRTAELLNRVGPILVSELDTQKLAEKVTDLATQLVGAQFGALFHNLTDEQGESYTLYTLSGVPKSAFENFPMPRNTLVFGPTFRGEGIVRSDDITEDPRYGKNQPYHGMPEGHLPVRSYLAVPIVSRTGVVLGGLFFGHADPGVFREEAEEIAKGIGAQAAIALDNAALFASAQRSHEALRRSNEELTRVNEDLNQFAHSASHDLQEPLRMVSLYSQLLRRKLDGKLDAEALEYIGHTVTGALRMENLVRDLLTFTQASAVGEGPPPPTSAEEALERALSNLRAGIDDAQATITHTPLPVVRIALVHLTLIFQNLISNAIKYCGNDPARIEIGAQLVNKYWQFTVKDNGIGIAPQYKEEIFGLFKRLHRADEYPGTGLGLAICQRIVHRTGGRIWVESEAGRGSVFFFTLPAAE